MEDPERTKGGSWPVLQSAQVFERHAQPCDGVNPLTKRACIHGHHRGYHADEAGARWLDEE